MTTREIKMYCKSMAEDCDRMFRAKGIQGWEQTIYKEREIAYRDVLAFIEREEEREQ